MSFLLTVVLKLCGLTVEQLIIVVELTPCQKHIFIFTTEFYFFVFLLWQTTPYFSIPLFTLENKRSSILVLNISTLVIYDADSGFMGVFCGYFQRFD